MRAYLLAHAGFDTHRLGKEWDPFHIYAVFIKSYFFYPLAAQYY